MKKVWSTWTWSLPTYYSLVMVRTIWKLETLAWSLETLQLLHVRDMYYMCTYNFWMVLTLLIFSVALTPPGSGAQGQICSSIASSHLHISPQQMVGVSTPQDIKQKEANLFGQMIDMYCLGLIFFMLCCPFSSDRKRDKVLMQYN